jgi:hypothetical protein
VQTRGQGGSMGLFPIIAKFAEITGHRDEFQPDATREDSGVLCGALEVFLLCQRDVKTMHHHCRLDILASASAYFLCVPPRRETGVQSTGKSHDGTVLLRKTVFRFSVGLNFHLAKTVWQPASPGGLKLFEIF